jgi:hypothetical protein
MIRWGICKGVLGVWASNIAMAERQRYRSKMKKIIAAIATVSVTVSAASQEMSIASFPAIGIETTIPVGEEIYSYLKVYTIDGARLDVDAKAGSWLLERIVPKGAELIPVSTKAKFKACVRETNSFYAAGPCFLDDDGDGVFDRHAGDSTERARKLKAPAPYTKIKINSIHSDSFKQAILYQGGTADSLRFSYREFKDDMARPAFTEELTIPREPFPSMILIKNLQIEVTGVSGMGLRYRIVAVK